MPLARTLACIVRRERRLIVQFPEDVEDHGAALQKVRVGCAGQAITSCVIDAFARRTAARFAVRARSFADRAAFGSGHFRISFNCIIGRFSEGSRGNGRCGCTKPPTEERAQNSRATVAATKASKNQELPPYKARAPLRRQRHSNGRSAGRMPALPHKGKATSTAKAPPRWQRYNIKAKAPAQKAAATEARQKSTTGAAGRGLRGKMK